MAPAAMAVVGGQPADRAEYPFFATVGKGCGGALVAPDRVLTAAHCMEVVGTDRFVEVGPTRARRAVRRIAQHPLHVALQRRMQREFPPAAADLMLLELASPVMGVEPAVVPVPEGGLTAVGTAATTIGRGAVSLSGAGQGVFRSGGVQIQDEIAQCADELVTAAQRTWSLCTKDPRAVTGAPAKPPYVSACFGDSGGPLVVSGPDGRANVVGVVSWGASCGTQRDPEVYADATRGLDFITAPNPVWQPQAQGAPRLVGTARVGGTLSCRPRWLVAPTRVIVTFSIGGRVRQIGPRTTYRVRSVDRGGTVRCDASGLNAGGSGGTPFSNGVRIG